MAITTDQKIDFLWKKIGFKASKTDTADNKGGPNEAIPAVSRIDGTKIWSQSSDIPAVQPSASAGVVTIYADSGGTATVETTADATSTAQRSWKTDLTDWIDPAYGSTYLVKVYADSASSTTPESTGTQLLGGESGYEWYFDYDSGVLHFIGTSIPGALSGKVAYIKGSRYTGNTGVPTAGSGSTATNVQFDPSNLNDIQSTDTDGNINLDPNGDGQVVIEGTNSAVMPVGTTAQRGTATQGGIRYNTDTTSFEGYSGSDWAGMGGLIDIDQDTHICAEVTSDADELIFTTGGVAVAKMESGEITFNDGNVDQDFRVKSDTSNYTLFVSGYGTGKVGLGTGAPNDKVEVSDWGEDTYIRINSAANKKTGVRFWGDNNWAVINDSSGTYGDAQSFVIHDSTANTARLEVKTSGAINIAGAVTAGSVTAGTVTSTGKLLADDTTNATTTTDGSLQTDGGLSVVCDGFIGGTLTAGALTATGRLVTDSTTNATTGTDGALQTDGGLSVTCDGFIGGALTATGRIVTDSTTNATSTTDGSLQTDGGLSVACDLYIGGDFTVIGSTFTIDSTTLTVADKNIDLGSIATPTDGTADGGGITLKGATDKTILWTDSTDTWDFNQGINVTSGDVNITTGSIRTVAEGKGFEGEGGYGAVRFATQSWTSASNKIVATFNMGAHQAAVCEMICCHTDWSNHSGGGRIVKVIFTSGYGSPGSIIQDSYTPSQFGEIAFSIGSSGDTRYLYVTNNGGAYAASGPGTVRIVMTAVSTSSWSLATS